jgi:hypothetical protein
VANIRRVEQLRILLVPEPVVQEALYGVSFPPDDVVEPDEPDD